MPRRSKRNIIFALDAAEIDVTGKGAQVSDDIQLVYVLDDIREGLYAYGASGAFVNNTPARIAMIEIHCRNKRGLIVDEIMGVHAGGLPRDFLVINANTQDNEEPSISAEVIATIAIAEGRPTKARVRSGNIPSAAFFGRPRFLLSLLGNTSGFGPPRGALEGLFIGNDRFLVMMSDSVNQQASWSLRWHELGD